MAASRQDLDTAITNVGTVTTQIGVDVPINTTEVNDLIAMVQGGGLDFTQEVTALNSIASSLQTADAAIQASIAAAKVVTGK